MLELGFEKVAALTVPDDMKPQYGATIAFYRKMRIRVETRRYTELWETRQLVKVLKGVRLGFRLSIRGGRCRTQSGPGRSMVKQGRA